LKDWHVDDHFGLAAFADVLGEGLETGMGEEDGLVDVEERFSDAVLVGGVGGECEVGRS